MKTFLPKDPGDNRQWYVVDAADRPLGRLATRLANVLRGKHKPTYSPQVDTGDFVVVVNAGKVKLTGRKLSDKLYKQYTGYWSGLKHTKAGDLRARNPDVMVKLAVRGMLPKNHLCRGMMSRLKVYATESHPHAAQKPQALELK